jgi:CBS domain-containing protein
MKARNLMQPLKDHLRPDDSLRHAARMLRTARRGEERIGVKALPVLDDAGRLVGILSIGDILKAVHPQYLNLMELGEFTWDGMVESFIQKAAMKPVQDIMTAPVITVRQDSPLMMCIDLMLKHDVKRVPVMDEHDIVVGMLYERDIFHAITRAMLEEPGGDS